MNKDQSENNTGSTGESQSSASGDNKARGNETPSGPGMQPGIEEAAKRARENAPEG